MLTGWVRATNLQRDERGTVGVMFALMSGALLMLAGVAIDFGRIQDLRQRNSDAIDAASLAAGRAMIEGKLSDGEIKELAKAYFEQNSKTASSLITTEEPDIAIDRENGKVDISVRSEIAMTLTRLGGFDKLPVPVATSATFLQRDVEVGLALDVTGSMASYVGGQRKIDALKSAFGTFADSVFPEQPTGDHKVRVGLAPYSASVNLGANAAAASNNKSKDGCVSERVGGGASDFVGDFHVQNSKSKDVDKTQDSQDYFCPNAVLTPLSDSKVTLIDKVNALEPNGSTGGHFGAQWAWNIVSDEWASTWGGDSAPDSYDRVEDGKLLKAVVLMTDGVFNVAFHGAKSTEQAVALCSEMKAKKVVVFSVGFGLDSEPNATLRKLASDTLKACASPGDEYFADASSPEELDAAFAKFAGQLNKLRLSK